MIIITLKRSIITALTVAVLATASLSTTAAPAAVLATASLSTIAAPAVAGGKHFGAGIVLGIVASGHRSRHYNDRRYNSRSHCWYVSRWSHQKQREIKRKICN